VRESDRGGCVLSTRCVCVPYTLRVLQCVAVGCSMLQCVAECCNVCNRHDSCVRDAS